MMARVEKLRELMKENNLQGFLVTSPYNLRYLTNFTGTTLGLGLVQMTVLARIIDNHQFGLLTWGCTAPKRRTSQCRSAIY